MIGSEQYPRPNEEEGSTLCRWWHPLTISASLIVPDNRRSWNSLVHYRRLTRVGWPCPCPWHLWGRRNHLFAVGRPQLCTINSWCESWSNRKSSLSMLFMFLKWCLCKIYKRNRQTSIGQRQIRNTVRLHYWWFISKTFAISNTWLVSYLTIHWHKSVIISNLLIHSLSIPTVTNCQTTIVTNTRCLEVFKK